MMPSGSANFLNDRSIPCSIDGYLKDAEGDRGSVVFFEPEEVADILSEGDDRWHAVRIQTRGGRERG